MREDIWAIKIDLLGAEKELVHFQDDATGSRQDGTLTDDKAGVGGGEVVGGGYGDTARDEGC